MLFTVSCLMVGINERRLNQVKQHFGISVSERTWKRWRRWWRDKFVATPFWQQIKGFALQALQIEKSFPRALLSLFKKKRLGEKIILLLRLLSPLTVGCISLPTS